MAISCEQQIRSFPMVAAREVFGDVLKAWFARNQWPQSISETWAKSVGSPGPWASQISPAINCKLDPKVTFFIALGNFNQAVAERNVLSVTNERVRNLLLKGQPLCHNDGVPYGAEDFFKLFTGLLEPPEELAKSENRWVTAPCAVGPDKLDEVTVACRDAFADVGGTLMLSPADMWIKIRPFMSELFNPEQLGHVQRVLAGYETLRPDIPASVAQAGFSRCALVIALEGLAPEIAKNSPAVARLDLMTSKTLIDLASQS